MIDKTLESFDEYIKGETLALSFTKKDNVSEKYDINGLEAEFKISKH